MDIETFEALIFPILITGLIGFMGFIIYDLAKQSRAGKWGTLVLFGALFLGVLGFVLKSLIYQSLQ